MKANHLVLLAFTLTVLLSCSKGGNDDKIIPQVASINVINAATGVTSIKLRISGKPTSYKETINEVVYGKNRFYAASLGPGSIVAVSASDTTKVLFNRSFQFSAKVYSMYLSGSAGAVDTMLREEVNLPFLTQGKVPSAADSVVNVRFVNLSAGSPDLKVKLISGNNTTDLYTLPYRGVGSWMKFSNKTMTGFEIRNAVTNAVVATYGSPITEINRLKNVALIIRGTYGVTTGNAAFGVSEINYF